MLKKILGIIILFAAAYSLFAVSYAQEQLTITTYYPSPFGSYRELRARRMAIGNNYLQLNNVCWDDPVGSCPGGATIVPNNTDLIIEGRVGIGTPRPAATLQVGDPDLGPANPFEVRVSNNTGNSALRLGQGPQNNAFLTWVYNAAAANAYVHLGTFAGNNDLALMGNGGNVGIGTTNPQNRLDIEGGMAVGTAYSGTNTAPPNGAIIQGNVGIGTASPVARLDLVDSGGNGSIRIGQDATCNVSKAGTMRYNNGVMQYCNGTGWVGFGVSARWTPVSISLGALPYGTAARTYTIPAGVPATANEILVYAWYGHGDGGDGQMPAHYTVYTAEGTTQYAQKFRVSGGHSFWWFTDWWSSGWWDGFSLSGWFPLTANRTLYVVRDRSVFGNRQSGLLILGYR